MKPVDQTISDRINGDCMRAVTASLLELPIEAVPHFLLCSDCVWNVFWSFWWAMGYKHHGNISRPSAEELARAENDGYSLKGCFYASVKSRVFPEGGHAVIINSDGLVVHDPSPEKLFTGVNVVETGEIVQAMLFEERSDDGDARTHNIHQARRLRRKNIETT